jgi:hypothetical protein
MPEEESDMLTEPYPDYLLPKRLRHLLWILGCLIFYGQFTSIALSRVAMDPQLGTHVFSGWTALAYLEWNAPAKIFIPDASELSSYFVEALWVAGFGSLAMFVAASVRRGRFTGLVLLLSLAASIVARFYFFIAIGGAVYMDPPWPFDGDYTSLADSLLESLLGGVLPVLCYPVMFVLAVLYSIWQIVRPLIHGFQSPRRLEEERPATAEAVSPSPPDYLLSKLQRRLLRISGGLIFYGLFTTVLLSRVYVPGKPGSRIFSAWTALVRTAWSAPEDIDLSRSTIDLSIVTAVGLATLGSLAMFVLAGARRRRFVGLLLLLCILLSLSAPFDAHPGWGWALLDIARPWFPQEHAISLADNQLEFVLGFLFPVVAYPILFCLTLFHAMRHAAISLRGGRRPASEPR